MVMIPAGMQRGDHISSYTWQASLWSGRRDSNPQKTSLEDWGSTIELRPQTAGGAGHACRGGQGARATPAEMVMATGWALSCFTRRATTSFPGSHF